MNALSCQPAIEPERTLGESPFRVTIAENELPFPAAPITHFGQFSFGASTPFAAVAPAEWWANRQPAPPTTRFPRWSPALKATERTITQQEIEDAISGTQATLAEKQDKLGTGKEPPLRPPKTRRTDAEADSGSLPQLPPALSSISKTISDSRHIVNRPPDSGDDLGLTCTDETWQRAMRLLIAHAEAVWNTAHLIIRPPVISAGPDGSVDLYWAAAPYGLLLNVPADPQAAATYYGDNETDPDSNRASGKLDSTRFLDPGVLMWLAHTAQR